MPKKSPKQKSGKPAFRYGINWELLESLIRNQESVTSMLGRTARSPNAYYYAKKRGRIFPAQIERIISDLDLPLSVVRQLIIEKKSP